MIRRTILTVLLLVFCGAAAAQKYPERRAIRSGNRQYEKGAYPEAETAYRRALEKTPDSPEATFNLSDACLLYTSGRGISDRFRSESDSGGGGPSFPT